MIKIAINGFGRIGRGLFRLIYERNDMQITQINEPFFNPNLLQHDSIYGAFNANLDNINITHFSHPSEFKALNCDVLIESSGLFSDKNTLEIFIKKGAKKVILSAPPKDSMPIFIYGVNEKNYNGENIISNASCTSNAIAPLIKALLDISIINHINISTIHPANSDQKPLDSFHPNARLGRNALLNIIPTQSSVSAVLGLLFKDLKNNIFSDSIRVPTAIVAFSNIDIFFEREIKLNDLLHLQNDFIAYDNDFGVSNDFIAAKKSIIARDLIQLNNKMARISLWFDNELGYCARLIDMIKLISK